MSGLTSLIGRCMNLVVDSMFCIIFLKPSHRVLMELFDRYKIHLLIVYSMKWVMGLLFKADSIILVILSMKKTEKHYCGMYMPSQRICISSYFNLLFFGFLMLPDAFTNLVSLPTRILEFTSSLQYQTRLWVLN